MSIVSTYLSAPREGHLDQVFHIFGYLKKVPKRRVTFDLGYPTIYGSRFKKPIGQVFIMISDDETTLTWLDKLSQGKASSVRDLDILNRATVMWHVLT